MVTFLDCVEPFRWEYFPLFLLPDLLTWWISPEMYHLRCICRDVRNSTDIHAAPYVAQRKAEHRACPIPRGPTFAQAAAQFAQLDRAQLELFLAELDEGFYDE